ncbi:hypothetical protein JCM16303_007418 [Sporobolomyces ruberrimus]
MFWLLTSAALFTILSVNTGVSATTMTHNITPRFIHSHNDYTRDTPFFDALKHGVMSFEADLHIVREGDFVDLAVSHDAVEFKGHQSFKTVYLDPLEFLLDDAESRRHNANGSFSGLYDNDPTKSIQLLIDYKVDGEYLHPLLIKYLDHFRTRNFLTTYDATTDQFTERAITVVCTGSCRIEDVLAQQPRDIFFDAPLDELKTFPYGREVSPLASVSLEKVLGKWGSWNLNAKRMNSMRYMLEDASMSGIKSRLWGGPSWPSCSRDATTKILSEAGVWWTSGDDLAATAKIYDDARTAIGMGLCHFWISVRVITTFLLVVLAGRWLSRARRSLVVRRATRTL